VSRTALALGAVVVALCTSACGPAALVAAVSPPAPLDLEALEADVQARFDVANPTVRALSVECRPHQAAYLCSVQDRQTEAVSLRVLAERKDDALVFRSVEPDAALVVDEGSNAARGGALEDREAVFELDQDEFDIDMREREATVNGIEAEKAMKEREKKAKG
jgi:hypothetical protein